MTRRHLARLLRRWASACRSAADRLDPVPPAPPAPAPKTEPAVTPPLPQPLGPLPPGPQTLAARQWAAELNARRYLRAALRRYHPDEPPAQC